MLQTWIPNTIPLPSAIEATALMRADSQSSDVLRQSAHLPVEVAQSEPAPEVIRQDVDNADSFSKGQVSKYFPYQGYGFVRDKNGHDIYFSLKEVDLVGPKGGETIMKNIIVGFDASWTSKGLHVKKMKIY